MTSRLFCRVLHEYSLLKHINADAASDYATYVALYGYWPHLDCHFRQPFYMALIAIFTEKSAHH